MGILMHTTELRKIAGFVCHPNNMIGATEKVEVLSRWSESTISFLYTVVVCSAKLIVKYGLSA